MHPFQRIQQLYTTTEKATVTLHNVEDSRVAEFSEALGKISSNEVVRESDRWKPVIRALNRYFFRLRAIPLPAGAKELRPEEAPEALSKLVDISETSYPQVSDTARKLLECTRDLSNSSGYAPILEDLKSTIRSETTETGKPEVVLLKTRSCIDSVRSVLQDTVEDKSIDVLYFKDVEVEKIYSNAYVIGRPRWFLDWLFQSPPAKRSFVFSFAWHRDSIDLEPALDFGKTFYGPRPRVEKRKSGTRTGKYSVGVDPDQIEPITDWEYLIKDQNVRGGSREYDESVEVRLLRLEDQNAVLVPADPDHELLLLDVNSESPTPVRVPVGQVSSGDLVLLRTEGEGDLLIPVADAIMGDRARELRKMQITWKKRLREKVENRDLETVAIELLEYGGEKANESNLSNWMSKRSIKPESREDFRAIMRLIGLPEDEDEYWRGMKVIESAHLQAGHKITDLLLKRVQDANVDDLRRRGRMEFSIAGEAGKMIALRILEISDETFEVSRHETKVPFSIV